MLLWNAVLQTRCRALTERMYQTDMHGRLASRFESACAGKDTVHQ